MAQSNAERQAAYRARHKVAADPPSARPALRRRAEADPRDERILELEAEVRRLKQELARRPSPNPRQLGSFNSQPFTPVPKVASRSR